MPPQSPYPVTGTITGVDGNVAVNTVVEVHNLKNGDFLSTNTNSSGNYSLDLANMTNDYTLGDPLLIRAYEPGIIFKLADIRSTISGSSLSQDLTLLVENPEQPKNIRLDKIDNWEHDPVKNAKKVSLVDSTGQAIKNSRMRENLLGGAGTGSSGDTDRVFTLTTTNAVDIVEVYLDGVLLLETTNYSLDNAAKTVTMVSQAVFDSQNLTVFYNV